MYRILTTEVILYLPSQKETSIYFFREIIHWRNIYIAIFNLESIFDEVMLRSVPQIKWLRVENFAKFTEHEIKKGIDYLPANYKEIILNR